VPKYEHRYGYMPPSDLADFWRDRNKQRLRDKYERKVVRLVAAYRRVANPGEEYLEDLHRTRMRWYDERLRRQAMVRRYPIYTKESVS
jgi:hypothetical protein